MLLLCKPHKKDRKYIDIEYYIMINGKNIKFYDKFIKK